jgi:hypothetical protein
VVLGAVGCELATGRGADCEDLEVEGEALQTEVCIVIGLSYAALLEGLWV